MNPVKDIKTAGICTNPKCEKPIFVGEYIWRKGGDPYCHSKCLIASFGKIK